MERTLIEVPIPGDTCVFDLTNEWLYLKSKPTRRTPIAGIPLVDRHYILDSLGVPEPIHIPQLLDVAPEIFKNHYNLQEVDTWGMNDREAKLFQPDLIKRLQGQPVTLEIAGRTYYLDIKNSIFAPARDNEYKVIKLQDIQLIELDKHAVFRFLFDFDKNEVAKVPGEHVHEIEIPSPYTMDQVGLCRAWDLPLIETIKNGDAIKNNYTAKILGKQQDQKKTNKNMKERKRGRRM